MRFRLSLLCRLGILFAALPICGGAMAADADYARIYVQNCAVCHGESGDGRSRAQNGLNPPPRDFTSPEAVHELDRERMIRSVTFGRPGTAMVPWSHRLSTGQIAGVVDYIRDRFMQVPPAASAAAPAPAAPPPIAAATGTGNAGHIAASIRPVAGTASRGEIVYRSHCSTCHGEDGSGTSWAATSLRPPPRDFTAASTRRDLTRERMLAAVRDGRPGTAMMSFASRLNAADIEAVVDYVRDRFMEVGDDGGSAGRILPPDHLSSHRSGNLSAHSPASPAASVASVDMAAPFSGALRGDAQRGAAIYEANCRACHGEGGDGRGPRAGFIQPPPRNFVAEESRRILNRPALYSAIAEGKRGTVMPAWKTVLDDAGIADVAEYVYRRFIVPEPLAVERPVGSEPGDEKKKPD